MTTPRHGHAPIPMRRVEGYGQVEKPGDYYLRPADSNPGTIWLAVAVPSVNARGWAFSRIPVRQGEPTRGAWGWDANMDAPTVSPSLHVVDDWHGWIRAGSLVEA